MKFSVLEYAFAGLIVALLLALGWGGWEANRRAHERTAAIACKSDVANFAATQKGNLDAIAYLQHQLSVVAEARRVEHEAAAKALAAADGSATAADKRAAELTSQLGALYAQDSNARAWGELGVDAGVAARLPGH